MSPSPRPRFYLTSAISYMNGPPHIGHAYEAIAADMITRAKRLDGFDVYNLAGADEHGMKVEQAARKAELSPQQHVDRITPLFRSMLDSLTCHYDDFVRTTEPRHHAASIDIWNRMKDSGSLYLGQYSGWYSTRDEAYYSADEITTTNGNPSAPTGSPVSWVEEESYFFNLSAWGDRLLEHYHAHPDFIRPVGRRNEIIRFVESGLNDLSISRTSFDWGVKVPGNPDHVMYVWVDALINYMTGIGYPDRSNPLYLRFWPADIHLVGKDIMRFHAVYWPAFLMAADLPLPRSIFGHGHVLNRGEKMSKSIGNVAEPSAMIEAYGVDPLRYFFLREVSFGEDGSYSHESIIARINADLANDLGNLAQRTLVLIARHYDGTIPVAGPLTEADREILKATAQMNVNVRLHINNLALHRALEAVMERIRDANRYFSAEQPWALIKENPERAATIISVVITVLRRAAILLQPAMPTAMAQMLDLLGVNANERDWSHHDTEIIAEAGTILPPPQPIFPRL